MRKLVLSVCLTAAVGVNAVVISPEAALQRATASKFYKSVSKQEVSPALIYTEMADEQPAAYVFDYGTRGGYVVVSADDEATPLLGYSTEGLLNPADMPDGLRYWLGYYAAEIDFMRSNAQPSAIYVPEKASRKAIAPMVATRWNQRAPYNDQCPLVGSTRTVTGCVATAMAQVMKYHNWPAKGKGSNSYSWNNTTLSMDFSTVTFDWDNMLDTYGSGATAAQNAAVATLMSACGISVNMSYGTGASGAVSKNCVNALVNNFDYDGSMRYLTRDYYSLQDWESEVYNSLAAGCPVLYGGQSNSGGHEFVCDGYSSDGYFHFNWGWGGMSDGYFKLTALNPESQGIGGAGSGAGYNFDQDIIVGIKPFAGQSQLSPDLSNRTDFTVNATEVALGATVPMSVSPWNTGSVAVTFKLGACFTASDGTSLYQQWTRTSDLSLQPGYYYNSLTYNIVLPSNLSDGEYTVTPVFLADGSWYRLNTKLGLVGSVKMTVADGTATFTAPAPATLPVVTDYSFSHTIYSGMVYNVTGTIENTGDLEFYDAVYGILISSSGNTLLPPMQVDLQGGESAALDYSGTMPTSIAAGDYQFAFVVKTAEGYTPISEITNITINAKPDTPQLSLGAVSFVGGSNHVPKNDLGVKTSLTCKSGVYYGTLDMVVFKQVTSSQWSGFAEFPSEMLYLDAGDSQDVVYHSNLTEGNVGETYLLMFYVGNSSFSTQQFIVLDAATGVDNIEVSEEAVAVELYNLSGQLVSGKPAPGHYIMVKRSADGTASTGHVIIK